MHVFCKKRFYNDDVVDGYIQLEHLKYVIGREVTFTPYERQPCIVHIQFYAEDVVNWLKRMDMKIWVSRGTIYCSGTLN